MSLDTDTALIRDYHANTDRFLDRLAALMQELMPAQTGVVTQSKGVFHRTKTVEKVTITIDNEVFSATRTQGAPEFGLRRMARGVVLSNQPLMAQEWLDRLKAAISAQADHTGRPSDLLRAFG